MSDNNNNNEQLTVAIRAKQAEIVNYERIFNAYWGRWRDLGWRHLQALRAELAELLTQQSASKANSAHE